MRTSDAPSHTVDDTAGVGKNEDDISMGNPDEDDVSSIGSVKLWVMPLDTDLSEDEHRSLIFDFFLWDGTLMLVKCIRQVSNH